MTTRVVNVRKESCDVYIGRKGKGKDGYFGNPFRLEDFDGDRIACLKRYEKYFHQRIWTDTEFRQKIEELKGKILGCFCHPKMCHGNIIVSYLEEVS